MNSSVEHFMPILFKVLFAFIIINMLINLLLLYSKRLRIYKLLAIYWPVLLFVFVMQGMFQSGNLAITLAYSSSLVSMSVFAMIGFEILKQKFPLKNYLIIYAASFALTFALYAIGDVPFVLLAMPFAIATALPLTHASYLFLVKEKARSTRLQKFLGIIYSLMAIHCINFALFRMEPDAQLWGWLVAYALYDTLAVIMPSIALEEANINENSRLQNLVDEKTFELNKTLKENENLLKVVLHDLSSPLMTMRFYLWYIKGDHTNTEFIEKAKKSHTAMEKIIQEVKNIYGLKIKNEANILRPVSVQECYNDMLFIFNENLERKKIQLIFQNNLHPETMVLADHTTLTHSVLSNLVSNAMKFSSPHSAIEVIANEDNALVTIEVKDRGPGITPEIIQSLMLEQTVESSQGTSGEVGSGFGLSIVKNFVESYGGHLVFESKHFEAHPQDHGTCIRVTLKRA